MKRVVLIGAAVWFGLLTEAGTVGAQEAGFQYPLSAAAAEDGTVYVADRNLPGVWKVTDGRPQVFFRASKRFGAPLNAVRCVAVDTDGKLLAGDSATREVYRFSEEGRPIPLTGGKVGEPLDIASGREFPADAEPHRGLIGIPMDIAVDEAGDLFVADLEAHRIWKVPAAGGEPVEFAEVPAPRGVTFDGEGQLWAVSGRSLVRVGADGKLETVVPAGTFRFPHNVRIDPQGTAYVSDGYARAVWKVEADAKPEQWVSGEPLVNPVGLAWRDKRLLIADPRANALFETDADGKLSVLAGK